MKTKLILGKCVNAKYDIMTSIRKLTYKSLDNLVDKLVYDSIRTPVRNSLWDSVYRSVDESIRRL